MTPIEEQLSALFEEYKAIANNIPVDIAKDAKVLLRRKSIEILTQIIGLLDQLPDNSRFHRGIPYFQRGMQYLGVEDWERSASDLTEAKRRAQARGDNRMVQDCERWLASHPVTHNFELPDGASATFSLDGASGAVSSVWKGPKTDQNWWAYFNAVHSVMSEHTRRKGKHMVHYELPEPDPQGRVWAVSSFADGEHRRSIVG